MVAKTTPTLIPMMDPDTFDNIPEPLTEIEIPNQSTPVADWTTGAVMRVFLEHDLNQTPNRDSEADSITMISQQTLAHELARRGYTLDSVRSGHAIATAVAYNRLYATRIDELTTLTR